MSKENRRQKPFYKKWLFITIFLVIIIGISGCKADKPKDEKEKNDSVQIETDNNESTQTEAESEGDTTSYYDALSAEEKDIFNRVADVTGKEKIITINLDDDIETFVEDDQYIYIQLQFEADKSSDKDMIKASILNDNKEIFKDLSEMKELSSIVIDNFVPLVNTHGDEVNNPVIVMKLERETLDETNWDNFSIDDFEDVADHYRQDPLLTE